MPQDDVILMKSVVVVVEPFDEQPDGPFVVLQETCLFGGVWLLRLRMVRAQERALEDVCESLLHETHSISDGTQFLQVEPMLYWMVNWILCWMVCKMS